MIMVPRFDLNAAKTFAGTLYANAKLPEAVRGPLESAAALVPITLMGNLSCVQKLLPLIGMQYASVRSGGILDLLRKISYVFSDMPAVQSVVNGLCYGTIANAVVVIPDERTKAIVCIVIGVLAEVMLKQNNKESELTDKYEETSSMMARRVVQLGSTFMGYSFYGIVGGVVAGTATGAIQKIVDSHIRNPSGAISSTT